MPWISSNPPRRVKSTKLLKNLHRQTHEQPGCRGWPWCRCRAQEPDSCPIHESRRTLFSRICSTSFRGPIAPLLTSHGRACPPRLLPPALGTTPLPFSSFSSCHLPRILTRIVSGGCSNESFRAPSSARSSRIEALDRKSW
jgi:hypothetical protein